MGSTADCYGAPGRRHEHASRATPRQKTAVATATWVLAFSVLLLSFSTVSQAAEDCEPVVGRTVSVEGRVEVQRSGGATWLQAGLGDPLCEGDTLRVGERSRAAVALINEAVLRIEEGTTMRLVDITAEPEEQSLIDLILGAILSFSRKPQQLEVSTPYVNGVIEGTEFLVEARTEEASITVFEGQMRAYNDLGSSTIAQGESVVGQPGKAPLPRIVARPRDAVQWSLYYPPILAAFDGRRTQVPADVPPHLLEPVSLSGRGDLPGAFAALDGIPNAQRDVRYYLYRASLLLAVGLAAEARADIKQALRLDPNAGLAYSLHAIIDIVQNRRAAALSNAERGVELSSTAAAKIALSYAQQAQFQIEAARDTLLDAVDKHPDDPLAWARLGELWLMLGDRRQARRAAEKARDLAPDLARTQLVFGYAALAEFRNKAAKKAFTRAIELSSADPMAHLGLGLAKISSGRLAEGRGDIEVAVALDSGNALLRAYLGKSYFEERRWPLDAQQYSIAKALDPNDPTAFLYDGILKQTINRPVEAVRDIEKSIELNDNRLVYRGRLLLDKDRAARGTSLARAYTDLGFTEQGINTATQALALDPANASAHRFLSDSYLSARRVEVARVSELLQAQLLQDININPIQPSIAATNLNIVTLGGPATPGFNEFTPLFERNTVQLNATGFGGTQNTYGGEGTLTAIYDRFSFGAGGFTYNTDGWRDNNGLEQNIYDFYGQVAITPELNVQAEYRHRHSWEGDLAFNFDPDSFSPNKSVERDQDTARAGLRYSPNPRNTFLFSYIYSDREETLEDFEELDPFTTFSTNVKVNEMGSQYEGQYIFQGDRFNIIAGGAYADVDRMTDEALLVDNVFLGPLFSSMTWFSEEIKAPRGYVYSNVQATDAVTWTVGASYDHYEEGVLDESSFNPKFGVQWFLNDNIRLRAAAFRTLKPALVNNRSIEPTQVAGFNQLFDDINGTKAWRYGWGLDWRISEKIAVGAAMTFRELWEPVFTVAPDLTETVIFEDREEQFHWAYLYWTPMDRLGVTAQFSYDLYEAETGIATEFDNLPERVETVRLPIAASYFHPSGFFGTLGGTYVHQNVSRSLFSTQGRGSDNFFLVDLSAGFRLPERVGIVSFGIKNLFDQQFMYQDDSFREFRDEPATGPYFPDRIFLGRVTLNF